MGTDANVLHLRLRALGAAQIETFLKKHDRRFREQCDCDWVAVRSFIKRVYDLSDLITRPILLTMVTETLLSGNIKLDDSHINIGAAALYDIYTSSQFDWDWNKGKASQLFTKAVRQQFAEALALVMFDTGQYEIDYDQILEVARENKHLLGDLGTQLADGVTVAEIAADIQNYTFLSKDDHGRFRFAHKSFSEFFVARFLWRGARKKNIDGRLEGAVPPEVIYFLGSFGNHDLELVECEVDPIFRTKIGPC